jgi:hypothetical protein
MARKENPLSRLDESLVERADAGDTEAARTIIAFSAEHLSSGGELPREWALWLANGLQQLLKGQKPDQVFGIKRGRGRAPRHSEEMQLLIGSLVQRSELGIHKSPIGKEGAITALARKYRVSEATVENYYQKYREFLADEKWIRTHLLADEYNHDP